ncbi:lytic transglycosylase domain-containing protein [Rhodanobacter sp. FDAARGOS 1247]|uniref:lytic transglycosylase domain-containing protein n=1 Tax=Rhodanobacter sp. FDAARGOS 1247 TaxID=2778082 RepID=UPI00195158C6|nr:lytic transglycosylase domain-containing protein [Rhodanobacter sp. FDAARGOS 1247]QRP62963.1 lytic transglycosylase domain-containing protein [Rhodanobacter sp. FDAARGOS 1247]
MFDVAGHGGSVGRLLRGFPLRTIPCGVALACGLLWWPSARAGVLYQCTGANGETVYSSSKVGYHGCRAISSYAAPAFRRKPAPRPRVSLTGVSSAVTTSARKLVDGSVEAAALTDVQGTVETSATPIGPAPAGKVSLASVQGSVTTAATAIGSPAAAMPGQWNYRESPAPVAAPKAAGQAADKVLRGAVYRIVRADGSVEYTNLPQVGGTRGRAVTMLFTYIATCAACNLHSTVRWGSVALNLTAYADTIRAASVEYGVDEAFLRAIIHAESAFNPRALSIAGAQGLMQLMPGTAGDMGVLDAFDSDQNIRGGARYLSLLLRDFNGDERLAAAAYNAGPGAVQRYNGVPPYAETQVYVERVGTLRKRYGAAIHQPLAARGPGSAP